MSCNAPATFPGTPTQRAANVRSHRFIDSRCMDCDCRPWGRVAEWPCGQEPPRVELTPEQETAYMARVSAGLVVATIVQEITQPAEMPEQEG